MSFGICRLEVDLPQTEAMEWNQAMKIHLTKGNPSTRLQLASPATSAERYEATRSTYDCAPHCLRCLAVRRFGGKI